MLKATYDAPASEISKSSLLEAAKGFLLHGKNKQSFIDLNNLDSLHFGASDLCLVNEDRTRMTVVRLGQKGEGEDFIFSCISYYFWLKQNITVTEILLNQQVEVIMYVFARDFSPAVSFLMQNLRETRSIYLVKYSILQVEGLKEPAISFQALSPQNFSTNEGGSKLSQKEQGYSQEEPRESASSELSDEELREFGRLKQLYLS